MTRDDHARKAAVRARMADTHEPYSVADRNLGGRARSNAGRARPATGVGVPPTGWPAWAAQLPATVAVWRNRDGKDVVAVLESGTDKRLATLSVPHIPTETLLAAGNATQPPLAAVTAPHDALETPLAGLSARRDAPLAGFAPPRGIQSPLASPTAHDATQPPLTGLAAIERPLAEPAPPHRATQPQSPSLAPPHQPTELLPNHPTPPPNTEASKATHRLTRETRQTNYSTPHHATETPQAEPGQQRHATETPSPGRSATFGATDRRHDLDLVVALGRPDLAAHRLGYQVRGGWHPWTDGSWRSPAAPADTRHTVTAEPAGTGLRLVVREQPGDLVVGEADVSDRLDSGLDRLGYTVAGGHWSRLPDGVLYARARPGHLAERDWWTEARVRLLRRFDAADISFEIGQVFLMSQHGLAGAEVDRGSWWIEGHRVPAAAVKILEVLEDHPPTWQAATLTTERVTELLAPYHPGAERAAAAWTASGLHVVQARDGLEIRTPGPEYRRVGRVGRDYWFGNVHSDPYQVTLPNDEVRELAGLPLDPVAAWDATVGSVPRSGDDRSARA